MLDFLIIGQGLAGSLLSYSLIKRGSSVMVLDEGAPYNSSSIAGGVYNPVTGRRLTKSWNIDLFQPIAKNIYQSLEQLLQEDFFEEKTILRIIASQEEYALLKKRKEETEDNYLGACIDQINEKGINQANGYCEIRGGGKVNTGLFLKKYRDYLIENNAYQRETFDYSILDIELDGTVIYKDFKAKTVIFSEGYKAAKLNPYFNYLPFNLVKGEILNVSIPGLTQRYIYGKSMLLTPMGGSYFKAGGTYDWGDLSEELTEEGKEELITKIEDIISVPYTIVSHEAGIRPATKDRRPFLGRHPQYPSIAIFNGMGTKGVLLAPALAENFAEYLLGQGNIIEGANIDRFNKK